MPHLLRGGEPDPSDVAVGGLGDRPAHVVGRVGCLPRPEPPPATGRGGDPVEPEGAPVVAVEVEREQVPAPAGGDEPVGLEAALAGSRLTGIPEGDLLGLPAGTGEQEQGRGVDARAGAVEGHRRLVDRVDLCAQAARQHLVELGERADGGLPQPLDRAAGGEAEADGDGDRLVVVEQQRGQPAAGPELVAARRAVLGVDGVAEVAQSLDVAPHAASRHPEPLGELGAAPDRA